MAELDPDYRMRGRPELAMLLADLLRRGYHRWRGTRGELGNRMHRFPTTDGGVR